MDNRTVRVFLACASGAGIGTLAALQLGHFWGLGALLGGSVGYLVYDLEQVIKMIPVAWNYAVNWRWEPNWNWWKATALAFCDNLSKYASIGIGFTLILAVLLADDHEALLIYGPNLLPTFVVAFLYLSSLMLPTVLILSCLVALIDSFDKDLMSSGEKAKAWNSIKYLNPFMVYIYLPLIGLAWVFVRIPAGLTITYNFIKQLFVLIHSDLRLLCGVDSLLGASIGYFTGNALIGALAGGALGVLNYELVSKRWLKVELRN